MFVILDTTEFYDAPQADSNSFRVLQEFLRRTHSRLIVPEVVFKETLNHAREQFTRLERDLKSVKRDYTRLQVEDANALIITPPDFERAMRGYEAVLRRKLRNSFNATFLPLPNATHDEVLERNLRRSKPFVKDKDGYADTLIWLSIINLVREQPGEYVFITNNAKDFSPEELIPQLGALPAGSSIRFATDLNTFIGYAKAALETIDVVRAELRATLSLRGFDLKEELSDLSSDVLGQMSGKLRVSRSPYREIEEPYYIEEYQVPDEVRVEEVYRAQDEVIVECSARFDCTINGCAFRSDIYSLYDEGLVHVTDWEWNEHYVQVEFSAAVRAKFLIRLVENHIEDEDGVQTEYSVQSTEVVEAEIEE